MWLLQTIEIDFEYLSNTNLVDPSNKYNKDPWGRLRLFEI